VNAAHSFENDNVRVNMKIYAMLFLCVVSFLSACNRDSESVQDKSQQALSEDNVFKGYETALDKAKAVEKTIHDAAKQREDEINRLGG